MIYSGGKLAFVMLKPVGKSHLSLIPLEDVTCPLTTSPCRENLEAAEIVRHCLHGAYFCHSRQFT